MSDKLQTATLELVALSIIMIQETKDSGLKMTEPKKGQSDTTRNYKRVFYKA